MGFWPVSESDSMRLRGSAVCLNRAGYFLLTLPLFPSLLAYNRIPKQTYFATTRACQIAYDHPDDR